MAFELNSVVPWGRNLSEYRAMFNLTDAMLKQSFISFGDGPASFNAEMGEHGHRVISLDPLYQFSKTDIEERIRITKDEIIEQTRKNMDNFIWNHIKSIDELKAVRSAAMERFLEDFDDGKKEGRYMAHELPLRTPFTDLQFDIGLSSHFLLLYPQLGLEFHLNAITEMLRCCREIRIFPILNLNAEKSEVLDAVIDHFNKKHSTEIVTTSYEFQKKGNQMLTIGQ